MLASGSKAWPLIYSSSLATSGAPGSQRLASPPAATALAAPASATAGSKVAPPVVAKHPHPAAGEPPAESREVTGSSSFDDAVI